ncbi:MAG TPA: hypothetical protein VFU31_27795 [Candidatus Binatia bacterium]|nr:hypothetical protein [Candidatus Binatia bacterium]
MESSQEQQNIPNAQVGVPNTTSPPLAVPASESHVSLLSAEPVVRAAPTLEARPDPPRAAAWKLALWGALGGAFGAALSFAIFEAYHRKQWFGVLLAVAWVMTWKRFAEPPIEEKLSGSGSAAHRAAIATKPGASGWLTQVILSVLLVVSVLILETIAEFIHAHARDDSINFLRELIGPAATMFSITLAWILAVRRPKPRAALFGALAGLIVPSLVFVGVGLYLYGGTIPTEYIGLWFWAAVFWGLAGSLGGWRVNASKGSNPLPAIALCLFILVVVWNAVLVPVFVLKGFSSLDVSFSVLLNFLRIFGWIGGLFFCPWTAAAF